MRTAIGDEAGEGALFSQAKAGHDPGDPRPRPPGEPPEVPELGREAPDQLAPAEQPGFARPDRAGMSALPSIAPNPTPGEDRSRFDEHERVVLYNDHHADYLQVKNDEAGLLDYLATLVAKEYVVYNNPRAEAADLAEEMVRMLVRVRRHLPRRR